MRQLMLIMLASLFFGLGCSTVPSQPRIHEFMTDSLNELAEGHVPEARQLLVEAKAEALDFDSYPTELDLLEAEILFTEGRLDEASSIAGGVLAENPDNPLANEITAKCSIRRGAYTEAESHLLSALGNHTHELDRVRVQDLLNLVWGLSAYSCGRVSEATKIWRSITDEGLRKSINEIVISFSRSVASQ